MIRYITRHGQVETSSEFVEGHMYPFGENPLSDLGRKQARLLGRRLAEMGFHGRIIASPYARTLDTASIIADETGSVILPYAPIREIFKYEQQYNVYRGQTIEEIKERYAHIDPAAELDYPWWTKVVESPEEVLVRVRAGIAEIEARYPDEPLLFVGHGASVSALHKAYAVPKRAGTMQFNCALSMIDPADADAPVMYCDTSHIRYEETTSNYLTRAAYDAKQAEKPWPQEIELPAGLESIRGTKILHIGDTNSIHYPFYFKLIETVKPDIILHTGDMADEVKVGRIPGTEYEYLTKIMLLLDAMQRSGARLIIVPGNNDLPREIARLCPQAEIYPVNTPLTLDGTACRVGHQVSRMKFDTDWAFYGHGLTGEEWKYEYNRPGAPCRFNATWGSFLCCLSEGKYFRIPTPKK